MNRTRIAFLAVALMAVCSSCSEETEYVTVVLQRPIDFAITCVASDYSFLDVEKCAEDDSITASWVLDADKDGVFVGMARTGSLLDFDPYFPGYSPIPVGTGLTRIVASPDSRNVFVAAGNQPDGQPALVRIPGDFHNLAGVAGEYPTACPILDMTVIRDETVAAGYFIAAILNCDDGDQLWKFTPVDNIDSAPAAAFVEGVKLADIPGTARFVSAGAGRVIVVSRDLPADGGYTYWDYLLVFDAVGTGSGAFQAVPVVNDSALAITEGVEGKSPDCLDSQVKPASGYVSGRVAVSPAGEFIYVPISIPAGVAVFDSSLARVDAHAFIEGDTTDSTVDGDTWQFADRFFQWMGYKDIRMDSPVLGVTFVQVEDGLRALAWLYGGQIVRIVVEPNTEFPWPHRSENDLEDIESSSYQPVVWYQGQELEDAIKTRSDLPSFGSKNIVVPDTDADHYVYYGIEFNGDIEAEAPENWTVTYEGIIPGASGQCGVLITNGTDGWMSKWVLSAGSTDFCSLGIEGTSDDYEGDIVDVVMPSVDACGDYAGKTLSFRVSAVHATNLDLMPMDATVSANPVPETCGGDGVAWNIRVSDTWVVSGSRTGFIHPWTRQGGSCVLRSDYDPIFTGRARTAMPTAGDLVVESCPIARGLDGGIDWDADRFRNPVFGFWVIPGCEIDGDYNAVVVPPVRGTVLKFAMETGRIPNQNDIGGLTSAAILLGGTMFSLDSSNGRLVLLDAEEMEITYSWF